MSGFSGILSFNEQTSEKLSSYFFPEKLHGYYTNWYEVKCRIFLSNVIIMENSRTIRNCFRMKTAFWGLTGVNLMNTKLEEIIDLTNFIKTINSSGAALHRFIWIPRHSN